MNACIYFLCYYTEQEFSVETSKCMAKNLGVSSVDFEHLLNNVTGPVFNGNILTVIGAPLFILIYLTSVGVFPHDEFSASMRLSTTIIDKRRERTPSC